MTRYILQCFDALSRSFATIDWWTRTDLQTFYSSLMTVSKHNATMWLAFIQLPPLVSSSRVKNYSKVIAICITLRFESRQPRDQWNLSFHRDKFAAASAKPTQTVWIPAPVCRWFLPTSHWHSDSLIHPSHSRRGVAVVECQQWILRPRSIQQH